MKNIQPDMNVRHQLYKGLSDVSQAIREKSYDKAGYTLDLVIEMMESVAKGEPQPWSNFKPRIQEEFDE